MIDKDKLREYMNNLQQRKEELEKGCYKKMHYSIKSGTNRFCGLNLNGIKYLCPICKAELKGINLGLEACEEILNSQGNKNINSDSSPVITSDEELISEGSVRKADLIMDKPLDTQILIKQAPSQRNQEIFSCIEIEADLHKSFFGTFNEALKNSYEMDKHYVIIDWKWFYELLKKEKELKKQLTTSEGKR